ncbi:hypothetical protein Pint_33984 [Pistacia integerrima]|uniref:Uncharacterized protein n=1 Tax=Pistacia integerrima TaxID=434235 RepID=A0ACC0X2Z0_9ROSI|nr:hypothetical protein Pint_33984 [Pistacia integerrima]
MTEVVEDIVIVGAGIAGLTTSLGLHVLIGCDGVNSVVAKWLGFKKPVFLGRSGMRGCADYKGSHGFEPKFLLGEKGIRCGFRLVMTDCLLVSHLDSLRPRQLIIPSFQIKHCVLRWPNENYLIISGH